MNDEYYVTELTGIRLPGLEGAKLFLITNDVIQEANKNRIGGLSHESILCFYETNARAICDLLNEHNSFNIEYESTKEIKEVMDCLNRYSKNLDDNIVKTVVEEVYLTRREETENGVKRSFKR